MLCSRKAPAPQAALDVSVRIGSIARASAAPFWSPASHEHILTRGCQFESPVPKYWRNCSREGEQATDE